MWQLLFKWPGVGNLVLVMMQWLAIVLIMLVFGPFMLLFGGTEALVGMWFDIRWGPYEGSLKYNRWMHKRGLF